MKPLLHDLTTRQLAAVRRGDASGYIFHGPRGTGKATTVQMLARELNCMGDEAGRVCVSCRQFAAGSYPDFIRIAPEERASITIEQVRGLIRQLALSPYHATSRRIVVIDEAHALTVEAQNALLKLIEEPPPSTSVVLVTISLEALLPTVRSRLVPIYFAPPADSAIRELLIKEYGVASPEAARLVELAQGAPGLAINLVQDAATAETLASLDETAASVLTSGLFHRLLLARRLAEAKANLPVLAQRLQRLLVRQLGPDPAAAVRGAHQLGAVEQFRRSLDSNMAPRVALERLMLEL